MPYRKTQSNVLPFRHRSDMDAVRASLEYNRRVKALTPPAPWYKSETFRFYMAAGILMFMGLTANAVILLWAAGYLR